MNLLNLKRLKKQRKHADFTKRSVAEKVFKTIEQDFDALKYHYERSERKLTRGQLNVLRSYCNYLLACIFIF